MDRTWKLLEKKCTVIVSCRDESEGRAKGDAGAQLGEGSRADKGKQALAHLHPDS